MNEWIVEEYKDKLMLQYVHSTEIYCIVLYSTVLCYLVVSLILSNSSIQHIPLSESTSAPVRNKCTVINYEVIIKNVNRTKLRSISYNFKTDSADSYSHQFNDYLPLS